jgi:glyceraldehyde 3-phosphate dehydrogenase
MDATIKVGINGFGRIGKCTFLQLLDNPVFDIKVLNTSLSLTSIEKYINRDSSHFVKKYKVDIMFDSFISINGHQIKVINIRDPELIDWRQLQVDYLFETTGAFLTHEKLSKHNAPYILLSSPPKKSNSDKTEIPMFCYGVNQFRYNSERIISVASCTTNCLAPFLDLAEHISPISEGSFITVHAATSSQSVVDSAHDNKRTNRSIFNNIIPHTTGASKCINQILPSLENKIVGTSVRVPVSIVSMIDVNLKFSEDITITKFFSILEKLRNPDIVDVNYEDSVSTDFVTTDKPTIIDFQKSLQISKDSIKFTLWYDNEWSYCAQMIRMCRFISRVNHKKLNIREEVSL